MKKPLAEIIAVRAVNQYRRRDVFAYLGLRYYLDNSAARSDRWAHDAAISLVLTNTRTSYLQSQHFKEFSDNGSVVHRTLFVPCPNEAYAESALLAECERHAEFANPACVHSYQLAPPDYRMGVFVNYFSGLQTRHDSIAAACTENADSIVRHLDAKKFYPSIDVSRASEAWNKIATTAGLSPRYAKTGNMLLQGYGTAGNNALLTGPMFAHLVANLVMREIDLEFSSLGSIRYVRYVDDITLVGAAREVSEAAKRLQERMQSLGIELHADDASKSIQVSSADWMLGKDDFQQETGPSWLHLIRWIKQLLVRDPGNREAIQQAFREHQIRIPVRDYSQVSREVGYLEWIINMSKLNWFRRCTRDVSLGDVIALAVKLRKRYKIQIASLLDDFDSASDYARKRLIPRIRFAASRLIYLSEDSALLELADALNGVPELAFHAAVMKAVATGQIDELLSMGVNAAQAAAQPMRAAMKPGTTSFAFFPKTKQQSLAVLLMNGVQVQLSSNHEDDSPLIWLAKNGVTLDMMQSDDVAFQNFACLHGLSEARHPAIFETAFDEDEALALDAIDQLNQSGSPG